jgi:pilus assembly protein Flp/PilA
MKALFKRFVSDEKGHDLIEYALLAGFISLAAIAGISALGGSLNDDINQQVPVAPGP